ncbi:MAG: GDP-mannose 4,6-dehydratase [Candidatus Bathyarchaeia archaeon]
MANVLITGCTGFIGSNLAIRLVERGYRVYGLIRHTSRGGLEALRPVMDRIRFVEGDLCEFHSLLSAIEASNPQFVIHLAALTPVRLSYEDPFPFLRTNFLGTCNLVHAILKRAPEARLIAASTAEVYGWQGNEPIKEDARLRPSSPYGVSKAAADEYIQMAMRVYGLRATVLRCNNTYGRRGERGFLVEYLITSMLDGGPVYVGAPNHVRDYMWVDDHVNAYLLSMEKEEAEGEVFNVSPGNPISNIELAKKLAEILQYKGRIVEGSYPPGYPMRPAKLDTEYIVLDSSKIRGKLGWAPSVTLDEGLAMTVDYWKTRK